MVLTRSSLTSWLPKVSRRRLTRVAPARRSTGPAQSLFGRQLRQVRPAAGLRQPRALRRLWQQRGAVQQRTQGRAIDARTIGSEIGFRARKGRKLAVIDTRDDAVGGVPLA